MPTGTRASEIDVELKVLSLGIKVKGVSIFQCRLAHRIFAKVKLAAPAGGLVILFWTKRPWMQAFDVLEGNLVYHTVMLARVAAATFVTDSCRKSMLKAAGRCCQRGACVWFR